MGRIYIHKRYYAGGESKWVSFETDPGLKRTKTDIYGKCVPCMTSLYEQLKEAKTEITLGRAHQCWKIVVRLGSMEECTEFLSEFESGFLGDTYVKGRFGSGDSGKSTKVIVFSAESESERDELYRKVKMCASRTDPAAPVVYHRACAELYHALLGDWRVWRETETVKNPEMVPIVLERIKTAFFWQKKDLPTVPVSSG